jgi:hypothetical protein
MIPTKTFLSKSYRQPLRFHATRRENKNHFFPTIGNIFIPSSLDADSQRRLSANLGGGQCKWEPPVYEVPQDIDFHKTFIAGYPSGDKRMVYLQMEALAGFCE